MFGTVRDAMRTDVSRVAPGTPLSAALARIVADGTCELFVVAADETLLGIVPDYELLKARLLDPGSPDAVESWMTAAPATLDAAGSLAEALPRFREARCARLPVVSEGRLVGRLDRTDLLRTLCAAQGSETAGVGESAAAASNGERPVPAAETPLPVDARAVPAPRFAQRGATLRPLVADR